MVNKKGEMMETIVKAIPVIIMAGILIWVASLIIDFGGKSVDREACRDSVLLKARSKVLGKPLIGNLNCETNLVEIDAKDKNELFGEIAGEMYDCWYEFGGGKVDFLDDVDFGKGDNFCFVCSRIDFDDNAQKEVGTELTGFLDYLKNENIPFKDQTFFEYFYDGSEIKVDEDKFKINTEKPLYIVFFGDKRVGDYMNPVTGYTLGGASGIVCVMGLVGTASTVGVLAPTLAFCGYSGISLFYVAQIKEDYIPMLYVGSDKEVIEACNQ